MDGLYIKIAPDFTTILEQALYGYCSHAVLKEVTLVELTIGPAILFGLLIGIYEAVVIHRDVVLPIHRAGHTLHALILSVLFVFCSMNAAYVLSLLPFLAKIPIIGTAIGLQVLIGLLAAIKIHAVSRAINIGGMNSAGGETWFHSILVGALVIAAPYILPFVKSLLPKWLLF